MEEVFAEPTEDEIGANSAAAREALVHFFVFFLNSMLVREEIALQLQSLYMKSVRQVIGPRLQVDSTGCGGVCSSQIAPLRPQPGWAARATWDPHAAVTPMETGDAAESVATNAWSKPYAVEFVPADAFASRRQAAVRPTHHEDL